MLIDSPRLSQRDRETWALAERVDAITSKRKLLGRRALAAGEDIRAFAARGPCYAGVSWGKDSTVLAHLVATWCPAVPLVWVRVEPVANPDCVRVRDAFLAHHGVVLYDEITTRCTRGDDGEWHATGTLENGFAVAAEKYRPRHVSGIRGDESAGRARRMAAYGTTTERTCAPLGRWTAEQIFAYLWLHRLPVHPAYAMTQAGAWNRYRIRVASLGGQRGTGHGRREWEWHYYRTEMRALGFSP